MDLSKLTRPAILCQCSRCSSSLAALENEWAKVSNSYSISTAWMSVDLHRISISSQKKQVPQSSEMSLLRGRILQEIACKLCQQKLGVLCELDNGPNILWKLSKVSFREIVTMRTVEPVFKEGALERLLHPTPTEPKRSGNSIQPGALVPTGSTDVEVSNALVSQQIQTQGLNLDHISSSVNNLHDTMSELKHAFTTLRIELNGPNRFPSESGGAVGNDFDMIKTVLKELKLKAEENENLRLELEAVKLKNRYMEEQAAKNCAPTLAIEPTLLQLHSPGLLNGGKKRPWPDSFPSGRTDPIADSFDDDSDSLDGMSLAGLPSMKIPLNDHDAMRSISDSAPDHTASVSPQLRVEVNQSQPQSPHLDNETDAAPSAGLNSEHQAIIKRPRLSQPPGDRPVSSGGPSKKGPGRPRRKSTTQISRPETSQPQPSQTPKTTPLSEQTVNVNGVNGSNQKETTASNPSPIENPQRGHRPTRSRSIRSRSRPPSMPPSSRRTRQSDAESAIKSDSIHMDENDNHERMQNGDMETANRQSLSEKENPPHINIGHENEDTEVYHKKRKAQVAQRDKMARLAMQREEAMETEEAR